MTIGYLAWRAEASVPSAQVICEFAAKVRYRTVYPVRARILHGFPFQQTRAALLLITRLLVRSFDFNARE